MTRDRLQELRDKMKDTPRNDSIRSSVRMKPTKNAIDDAYDDIDRLQGILEEIGLARTGTVSNVEMNTQQLDGLVQEFQQTAERVRLVVHNLKDSVSANDMTTRGRIHWARYQGLSKKLADLMVAFNNEQLSYREKCKGRVQRALRIMGENPSERELEDILHEGYQIDVFVRGTSAQEIENARLAVEDVKARQREIAKLEASIYEMTAIFRDISALIETQGEGISRIEDHVSNASYYTQIARTDISKTRQFGVAPFKKKFWIAVAAVLLLALIVIIVALVKK